MRSPAATLDLRAALSEEIRAALQELNAPPIKPKAVHRCRVRIKRARALARVGRANAPGLSAVFNESARTIMHALSRARELTALSAAAREAARKATKKQAAALEAAADMLEGAALATAPIDIEGVTAGLRDLLAMAQVWPEASERQVHKGAERIARRARRARRRGHASAISARRHEWRKREKDRLYAALLLNGAWPDERKRRRKQSERLGDALGAERDTLLLLERLAQEPAIAGGPSQARRARQALHRRARKLSRRADALGERLHAGGA